MRELNDKFDVRCEFKICYSFLVGFKGPDGDKGAMGVQGSYGSRGDDENMWAALSVKKG